MSEAPRILAIDDDEQLLTVLSAGLRGLGFAVDTANAADKGLAALEAKAPNLILLDFELGEDSGLEVADRVRGLRPDLPIVMMTGHSSLEVAVNAMRAGIQDFITKPIDLPMLDVRLRRVLEHQSLVDEVKALREASPTKPSRRLLGESPAIERMRELVRRVADSDVPVLITGESGTGKEMVARELHDNSPRAEGPFVAVNCATFVENLVESELFGHKKGSFTDARHDKDGLFVNATGGTLFLDEVGELSLDIQAKLLRALQERKVRPVGAPQEVSYDARILAATNRDLEEAVESGAFREDLYYRLSVVDLQSPPLRVRGHDIILLAQHFLEEEAVRSKRDVRGMLPEVARRLLDYDWPGNVRELQNSMRRAVTLAAHDQITVADLPERIQAWTGTSATPNVDAELDPEQLLPLAEVERRYIRRVLELVGGNKSQAARVLGLNRRTLYRRLDQMDEEASASAASSSSAPLSSAPTSSTPTSSTSS